LIAILLISLKVEFTNIQKGTKHAPFFTYIFVYRYEYELIQGPKQEIE